MCRAPGAPPGGYHGGRRRPASRTAHRREAAIQAVHGEVEARCGSPRIRAELAARGRGGCADAAAGRMRSHGIAAGASRESRRATGSGHDRPVAGDAPGRRSQRAAPDRARVADITAAPTGEGWLYLAAVEAPHRRRIAGWSMPERIDSRPAVAAPEMAVSRRPPGAGPVAHSGRGSRYAGEHGRRRPARRGITCGAGRRADCRGSVPMGPPFAGLKKELTHGAGYATRREARARIFESIEVSDGRVRRHPSLSHRSPDEYERAG